MGDKKYPGKFTVRFNIADPQQRAAAELLNQQGRCKAQFLTNAVLFYVQAALGEQKPFSQNSVIHQRITEPETAPVDVSNPERRAEDDDIESIRKTMEAFQFSQNNGA